MESKLKYTINNLQKRDYEEVNSAVKWLKLVLVLLGCVALYKFADLGLQEVIL